LFSAASASPSGGVLISAGSFTIDLRLGLAGPPKSAFGLADAIAALTSRALSSTSCDDFARPPKGFHISRGNVRACDAVGRHDVSGRMRDVSERF
jgi:hypothetical protein